MSFSISWSQYFTTLGLFTVLYYLTIAMLYYRKNIDRVLAREENRVAEPVSDLAALLQELSAAIHRAAATGQVQPELLFSLRQAVHHHPSLQSSYEARVSQFIHDELEIMGLAPVSAQELAALWKP